VIRPKLSLAGLLAAILVLCISAPAAQAGEWGIQAEDFGIESFDGQYIDENGLSFTQAGGHPYEVITQIVLKHHLDDTPGHVGRKTPNGQPRNIIAELPPGFLGNATVGARCSAADLAAGTPLVAPPCPTDSVVGGINVHTNGAGLIDGVDPLYFPIFNMDPPVGFAARFGFNVLGVPIVLDATVKSDGQVLVGSRYISQALRVYGVTTFFWGVPADPRHDIQRCTGPDVRKELFGVHQGFCAKPNSTDEPQHAFLTMPTSCTAEEEGLKTTMRTDSWFEPGVFHTASFFSHRAPYAPEPPGPQLGTTGCDRVPLEPKISVQPTIKSAAGPTGLQVKLDVPTDGILNPDGISQAQIKKAVVTLPEGVTINPSQAEGLGVCTAAQYAQETIESGSTEGCPSTSKIGTVGVDTPLLKEHLEGTVYVAEADDPKTSAPGAENPFDSLLAIYVVIENQARGILVKMAGKVSPDHETGQIVTTFDDLPRVAFESFDFRFREGPRAPLITPPACGTYTTQAEFTPYSNPQSTVHAAASFDITSGVNGGPCPQGGLPPFNPAFSAGSINNSAGRFSPFLMRLIRSDGEQDMTKFSATLPKGVAAKIAGVTECPESAIALAKAKSGKEELASPSCPASSQIGRILAGAGVGTSLTYVSGSFYLAGPYQGAPISALVVTPAVAGPFDVGTVITRVGLTLNPKTGEVEVDGDKSDPIPHILAGIPLAVRDIRVYADRPDFTINPTSCDPSAVGAKLFGSFLDVLSPIDDVPVALSSRFQAADCAALPFKPKLDLRLSGATRQGGFPKFATTFRARPGDANVGRIQVTLPKSAFLEQSHFQTICTRVQFAAKACPPGAIYGHVRAFTPLLDQPLEGPVLLRSSDHELPDLVFDLHGKVDIEVSARIDSERGGIRATVEDIPDAPVDKVVVSMRGGKKGLIVNSQDLCASVKRAKVRMRGQNGKPHNFRPKVKAKCGKKRHR
jgi:hypothetical protein